MKKIKKKTSEVKEHSEFGGSQAERIMNCPGSVLLCRGKEGKDNPASWRGTAAHACLEFIINNRDKLKEPTERKKFLKLVSKMFTEMKDKKGKVVHTVMWDELMIEDALSALTWILKQKQKDGVLYVEERLDTSAFTTKNQSSTLDVGIANYKARELIIIDYKYGKYKVDVKKNSQLIYYALGMLLKLNGWKKFDKVRLVIIQPYGSGKAEKEYHTTVDECIKWGKKFRKTVKIALKPKAPFKIGDKYCYFCLGKNECPAMKKRMIDKEFGD